MSDIKFGWNKNLLYGYELLVWRSSFEYRQIQQQFDPEQKLKATLKHEKKED